MDSLTSRFQKEVFEPYLDLLRAEYRFHPDFGHARQAWEKKLSASELINGPYLEKSLTYQAGEALPSLGLHEQTVATIRNRLKGRGLWKHQTDALRLLLSGENVVVATGTSSGKTLCYQIPILDDLVRESGVGLRAIIIYPLNALVNDQLSEWEEILRNHPEITFARFTGQTPADQQKYESTLRETFRLELSEQQLSQQELQKAIESKVAERLRTDPANRLNHREAIRARPPHVLITNFSMLEYLLERPIDSPIFDRSRLKFLVLDEAHAYRGVQATEIAFLVRRIKDRLAIDHLQCIATSATLGKPGDSVSEKRVRDFVSQLFGESFHASNPVYGTPAPPAPLDTPALVRTPEQYISVAEEMRSDPHADLGALLSGTGRSQSLRTLLESDGNLLRLRHEILKKPTRLDQAADRLWPGNAMAVEGLEALLEIVATAKKDDAAEDLLPTRLHYFIRAQDGLHVCLHRACPGRHDERPSFFVSRRSREDLPEGSCPDCESIGQKSKLVEVVTCRKCGYLYGALQDLGPRRAQTSTGPDAKPRPQFDSFSTELGWASDAYWSYLSIDDDLPYPTHRYSIDDDEGDLLDRPVELDWCVICGKKKDKGEGDNCRCASPHLRRIKIFHRQCPNSGKAKDRENLYSHEKTLLGSCPNCGARNVSGIEPVQRFQESDDEMGLAMAVPFAHFQISGNSDVKTRPPRKLLCFTDHRQRAAAFPSLLEEETFSRDMGRKIVEIVAQTNRPIGLVALGDALADAADPNGVEFDPDFFLPVSRFPDQEPDAKAKRDLWIAETFAYFGIPDSARESAEDFGLVLVECTLTQGEQAELVKIFAPLGIDGQGANSILQVLLGFVRKRKAFTLPKGRVTPDALAFGRVRAGISFVKARADVKDSFEKRTVNGWMPSTTTDNVISDYLSRCLGIERERALRIAEQLWEYLTSTAILIREKDRWKLGHEKLFVAKAQNRYVCNRRSRH